MVTKANGSVTELEGEVYYPSQEVCDQAILKDWDAAAERACQDPLGFWEQEANELEWCQKWDQVLDDSNKPFFKWFSNAKVNIVHNSSTGTCIPTARTSWR